MTASVANIATVASAAMTTGSYTIDDTAYGYRSAALTAKAGLGTGSYSWSASANDGAGNGPRPCPAA